MLWFVNVYCKVIVCDITLIDRTYKYVPTHITDTLGDYNRNNWSFYFKANQLKSAYNTSVICLIATLFINLFDNIHVYWQSSSSLHLFEKNVAIKAGIIVSAHNQ